MNPTNGACTQIFSCVVFIGLLDQGLPPAKSGVEQHLENKEREIFTTFFSLFFLCSGLKMINIGSIDTRSSRHRVFLWRGANARFYPWHVSDGSSPVGGRFPPFPPSSALFIVLRVSTPSLQHEGWQLCHLERDEGSTHQLLPLLGSWDSELLPVIYWGDPGGQPRCCISYPCRLPRERSVCWLYSATLVWQRYLGLYITLIFNLSGVEGTLFHFSCLIAEDEKPFRLQVVKTFNRLGP